MSRTTSKISKLTSKCAPLPTRAAKWPKRCRCASVGASQEVAACATGGGRSNVRARSGSGRRSQGINLVGWFSTVYFFRAAQESTPPPPAKFVDFAELSCAALKHGGGAV
jgi:hypothetical protein